MDLHALQSAGKHLAILYREFTDRGEHTSPRFGYDVSDKKIVYDTETEKILEHKEYK